MNSIPKTLFKILTLWFSRRPIVFGPYHGEFGFEVTEFSSMARFIKSKYKRATYVISLKGHKALYPNCDDFLSFEYNLVNAGYGYGFKTDAPILRNQFISEHHDFTKYIFIDPSEINIGLFKRIIGFKYFSHRINTAILKNRVAVHFRAIKKNGYDLRENFTDEKADELVKRLSEMGKQVMVIGHPKYSYCPHEFCVDCRANDISKSIQVLSSSAAFVGQLSGPTHLAHFCEVPVITWAEGSERFKTIDMWNPFKIRTYIVSTISYNPTIDSILAFIKYI